MGSTPAWARGPTRSRTKHGSGNHVPGFVSARGAAAGKACPVGGGGLSVAR